MVSDKIGNLELNKVYCIDAKEQQSQLTDKGEETLKV